MEANSLDPIRHQINAGDRQGARLALAELLEAEPDNADAWALLAILLSDPAEQAKCYREILRINPEDRHAEVWLESLTALLGEPPASPPPVPKELIQADEEAPAPLPAADGEELHQLLDRVSLPGTGDATQQPARKREMPRRPAEQQGFLNGLLGRFRGGTVEPEIEAQVLDQGEPASTAGSLSPELILRLAGGPLAPEERRNCPQCDAVVSRREATCPWCSAHLPDAEPR
jgi:tetratricopeptide (TPR) repeat protein